MLTRKGRKYLLEAYDSGWISSKGAFVEQFEELFAAKHGMRYGVACSSGFTALILALRAVDIEEGDTVVVPNFTMIATAWAASQVGAKNLFVDCADDLLIAPKLVEQILQSYPNEKIKAVMPVHIYGRQCDMDGIMKIAYEYNLRVIEDSAEAHGVKPRGDIACFSLFGNKIISSGEGGICLTNDLRLAEQMRHLRSMAFDPEHTFLHKKMGYNFRMTNMQAAVALSQTEVLEQILEKRRQIEMWYDEALKDVSMIRIMPKRNVLWMYDIMVPATTREPLRKHLDSLGIETRLFFRSMLEQPMYYHPLCETYNAFRVSKEGLYLPTFTQMTQTDVKRVAEGIKSFFNNSSIKSPFTI